MFLCFKCINTNELTERLKIRNLLVPTFLPADISTDSGMIKFYAEKYDLMFTFLRYLKLDVTWKGPQI